MMEVAIIYTFAIPKENLHWEDIKRVSHMDMTRSLFHGWKGQRALRLCVKEHTICCIVHSSVHEEVG